MAIHLQQPVTWKIPQTWITHSGFTLTDRHSPMAKKTLIGRKKITHFCQFGKILNSTYDEDFRTGVWYETIRILYNDSYTTLSETRRHIAVALKIMTLKCKISMAITQNLAKQYFLSAKIIGFFTFSQNGYIYSVSLLRVKQDTGYISPTAHQIIESTAIRIYQPLHNTRTTGQ